jgi:hypothetical protein
MSVLYPSTQVGQLTMNLRQDCCEDPSLIPQSFEVATYHIGGNEYVDRLGRRWISWYLCPVAL